RSTGVSSEYTVGKLPVYKVLNVIFKVAGLYLVSSFKSFESKTENLAEIVIELFGEIEEVTFSVTTVCLLSNSNLRIGFTNNVSSLTFSSIGSVSHDANPAAKTTDAKIYFNFLIRFRRMLNLSKYKIIFFTYESICKNIIHFNYLLVFLLF